MQGNDEQFSLNNSETNSTSSKESKANPSGKKKPRNDKFLNIKKSIANGQLYSSCQINGRNVVLNKSQEFRNVDDKVIHKTLYELKRNNPDFDNYFKLGKLNSNQPYLMFNDSYQITEETNPIEILKQLATPQKKTRLNFSAMLHSNDNIVSIELVEHENTKKALLIFKPPYDSVEYSERINSILWLNIDRNRKTFGTYFEPPSMRQSDIKPGLLYLILKEHCGLNSEEDVMAKLKEFWPIKRTVRTYNKTYKTLLGQIEDVVYEGMTAKFIIKGVTEENSSKVFVAFSKKLYNQYRFKREKFTQFFDRPHQTPSQPSLILKSQDLLNKDKLMSALTDIVNSKRSVTSKKRSVEPSKKDKNIPAPKRRRLEQGESEDKLNTVISNSTTPTVYSVIQSAPMQANEPSSTILPQFQQSIAKLNAIPATFQASAQEATTKDPQIKLDKMSINFLLSK